LNRLPPASQQYFEAYEILQSKKIDLIFLDTDLPKVSGVDFIKSLDNKPPFIFLSSNANLAIEGFNLNAIDFLLKPFSLDRFLRAANKALLYHSFKTKKFTHPDRENNESTYSADPTMISSWLKPITRPSSSSSIIFYTLKG
jgi:two-component SAPR family response regulator